MIAPLSKLGPTGKSRVEEKRERERAQQKTWRLVCAVVDARDKKQCRICGKHASPYAVTLLDRLHRHHIIPRSRCSEHEPWNVVSLCATCHALIHVAGTVRLEGDADLRDVDGRLCGVKVERLEDEQWKVIGWV